MSTCTDVYVRPQTCNTISIYPSQVHPGGGGGTRPGGVITKRIDGRRIELSKRIYDDDEALALALLLLT